MFMVQNGHFSKFFLGFIRQENVFYESPERKNVFLGYKNKKLKKSKRAIFPKELTYGFCLKMAIFQTFVLQVIQARKMSFMIFQNLKSPFQAIKTRSSKSQKMAIFPKGLTLGFGLKMAIFLNYFKAIQARKMSFTKFQNEKNAFLGYRNKNFKKNFKKFQKG